MKSSLRFGALIVSLSMCLGCDVRRQSLQKNNSTLSQPEPQVFPSVYIHVRDCSSALSEAQDLINRAQIEASVTDVSSTLMKFESYWRDCSLDIRRLTGLADEEITPEFLDQLEKEGYAAYAQELLDTAVIRSEEGSVEYFINSFLAVMDASERPLDFYKIRGEEASEDKIEEIREAGYVNSAQACLLGIERALIYTASGDRKYVLSHICVPDLGPAQYSPELEKRLLEYILRVQYGILSHFLRNSRKPLTEYTDSIGEPWTIERLQNMFFKETGQSYVIDPQLGSRIGLAP